MKANPRSKPKRLSIPSLTNKLDRVFSEFIRLRDSDANGYIRCYCCGKLLPWRESENMHFIPRQHKSLRFSEINCHAGCTRCNHYMNGNIEEYALHLKKDYGDGIIERLTIAKHAPSKITAPEYELMIAHYKREVGKMKEKKITGI